MQEFHSDCFCYTKRDRDFCCGRRGQSSRSNYAEINFTCNLEIEVTNGVIRTLVATQHRHDNHNIRRHIIFTLPQSQYCLCDFERFFTWFYASWCRSATYTVYVQVFNALSMKDTPPILSAIFSNIIVCSWALSIVAALHRNMNIYNIWRRRVFITPTFTHRTCLDGEYAQQVTALSSYFDFMDEKIELVHFISHVMWFEDFSSDRANCNLVQSAGSFVYIWMFIGFFFRCHRTQQRSSRALALSLDRN